MDCEIRGDPIGVVGVVVVRLPVLVSHAEVVPVESENTENGNRVKSFSPTECFAIYFLIDFAANLFSSERHSTNSKYDDLKRRIIQDYLRNEEIDDKIPASLESLDCLEKRPVDKNIDSANSILINLLTTCDFIFILYSSKTSD